MRLVGREEDKRRNGDLDGGLGKESRSGWERGEEEGRRARLRKKGEWKRRMRNSFFSH